MVNFAVSEVGLWGDTNTDWQYLMYTEKLMSAQLSIAHVTKTEN